MISPHLFAALVLMLLQGGLRYPLFSSLLVSADHEQLLVYRVS